MELVLVTLFVAPVSSFLVGAIGKGRWRKLLLGVALLAPLILYTVNLARYPSAESGFWAWWSVGLMFLAVPLLLSFSATLLAYFFGSRFAVSAGAGAE